ncbi:YihY/virulence factor BrkB family protein [Marinilabilia sp.]|uniref:YihY/virulence factor BrkB family protein n=1 Tax=Marinilabilia sp. TaxID=2021252 RepID=UPI0025BC3E69|nr:YihY/virulence factor BrkB family protein [Marinilabilia sp.]
MSENGEVKSRRFRFKDLPGLLKRTAIAWNDDDPWRQSAIVAYYAILALPGLLVIIIGMLSSLYGTEIVEGRVYEEIKNIMGASTAKSVESIFRNTRNGESSWVSTVIGIGALVFGATGVFYHLQISLNRVWQVKSEPKNSILQYLIDRTKSFGFVLVIGFLLLISFILTAMLNAFQGYISRWIPDVAFFLLKISDVVISFGVITVLFALIFKYLPDVRIAWRSVWVGSFITSSLFSIGKEVLSFYFGEASPGSVYGAAGSIIIILLWVSYSCLILFFGAEFTWIYARHYGHSMAPRSHARALEPEA